MDRIQGLRRLFRHEDTSERVQRDVDDEIAFHLDAVTAELVSRGMDQADARRVAEQRFGDMERHRSAMHSVDSHRVSRARWRARANDLVGDLRYALRTLGREPLFTIGAVLTIAIGIAANATMFGVIDRLLLRPPPHVRDGDDMSLIYLRRLDGRGGAYVQTSTSYPDYVQLRDSSGVVASAAAFWSTEASLDRGAAARKVSLGIATGNMFTTLGARPELGRWFGPLEDDPATTEVPAVVSDAMWHGVLASDPKVLGRRIQVDQRTYTIVGVAPPGFHGPLSRRIDLWVPMRAVAVDFLGKDWETTRNMYWLRIVAARKPGVTVAMAGERATLAHQRGNRAAKKGDTLTTVIFGSIVPARGAGIGNGSTGGLRQTGQGGLSPQGQIAAWLTGVAAVVLLIVCANLANLLLSRASRRRREIAVRMAMGVRRGRLVRQLLSETILLCALGGALGLLLAYWGAVLMRQTLMSQIAWDTPPLDGRLIAFTLGATLVTALVAGLAPAVIASGQELTGALKSATRDGGHRRTPLQRTLLVVQAALSVALLCGAGLFVKSLRNVSTLRLGYDADRVLVANIDATGILKGKNELTQFWQDARERVRQIPGVASASLGVTTPFASSWATDFFIPGRDSLPELKGEGPYVNAVSWDFLQTMGTRLLRGRGFTDADVTSGALVAVVNQVMAERLWPAGNAIGQCIKVGADTVPCTTVIGVTENAFRDNIREETTAQYLVLQGQRTWDEVGMRSLFVRTSGDVATIGPLVREQLQSLRPNLPFADVQTLQRIIDPELQPWRLGAAMFGLFGAIALVVAVIGLYAVVAYDVSQRWHELGVRSALGARPGDIIGMILGDGVRHAIVGLALGTAVTWAVAPLLRDLLFGVSPRDASTYALVAAVLVVASLTACLMPARRASRVAPAEVLRSD